MTIDYTNWDEVEQYLDDKYGKLHEYTVIVYTSTDERFQFPLFAKDAQSAFKNFDAMYMQLCSTKQVYPYTVEGGKLDARIDDAVRIELLDYLSEEVLASYGVG